MLPVDQIVAAIRASRAEFAQLFLLDVEAAYRRWTGAVAQLFRERA